MLISTDSCPAVGGGERTRCTITRKFLTLGAKGEGLQGPFMTGEPARTDYGSITSLSDAIGLSEDFFPLVINSEVSSRT